MRLTMPKFDFHFVGRVVLPHDAERGSVNSEADAVTNAVYGDVAN